MLQMGRYIYMAQLCDMYVLLLITHSVQVIKHRDSCFGRAVCKYPVRHPVLSVT